MRLRTDVWNIACKNQTVTIGRLASFAKTIDANKGFLYSKIYAARKQGVDFIEYKGYEISWEYFNLPEDFIIAKQAKEKAKYEKKASTPSWTDRFKGKQCIAS